MALNFQEEQIRAVTDTFRYKSHSFRIRRVANVDELIDRISDEEFNRDERLPYWAELWPSAIGLSRFLLDQPELVRGKQVLELGCGLGLTSLVLQTLAPAELLITDYEPAALHWALENFRLNELTEPQTRLLDWRAPELTATFDRIVASDVLYEERFFLPLIKLVQRFLRPDGLLIIAEPGRPIARKFFDRLADAGFIREQRIEQVLQDERPIRVGIHLIQRDKR
ncbi:MAG TPA: methyltransferase domain-containing protein [Caldithrix abyssi]|uniref:Methyltransferase domain-containing protein n=1 Tax=Caldithrix abyssi TaxID=187145 RepID=A0A7V5UEF0_CALAY|nr:methyltransferase domain-containing protein [Caldithrix abyssi]